MNDEEFKKYLSHAFSYRDGVQPSPSLSIGACSGAMRPPRTDPEPRRSVRVLSPGLLMVSTEEGVRGFQTKHIESVVDHQGGCIVKTASGDFHQLPVTASEFLKAMADASRS